MSLAARFILKRSGRLAEEGLAVQGSRSKPANTIASSLLQNTRTCARRRPAEFAGGHTGARRPTFQAPSNNCEREKSGRHLTDPLDTCICTIMNKKQNNARSDDPLNMGLCTCANVRKAARIVTQMYETALQETGLKAGQVTLLAVLSKLGNMPLTSLADELVMDRTTLTRNLKPMVRDGLISIEAEEDQRVRVVGLTEKGGKIFKRAYPLWAEAQSRLVDNLGQERWSRLVADLNAAVEVAREG